MANPQADEFNFNFHLERQPALFSIDEASWTKLDLSSGGRCCAHGDRLGTNGSIIETPSSTHSFSQEQQINLHCGLKP